MDRTAAAIPKQPMAWEGDSSAPEIHERGGAAPLTPVQARLARADPEVRRVAERLNVDLDGVIANLLLAPEARLEAPPVVATADFAHLLAGLRAHRVRFVLIGGIAARLHGSTYGTADFDICHARDGANLRALAVLLGELEAEYRRMPAHGPPRLEARIFATETDFVFTTRHGKFDLIGEFTGVGRYAEAASDALQVPIQGGPARLLSLRQLIASKRSTGRTKDQLVAAELETIAFIRERLGTA